MSACDKFPKRMVAWYPCELSELGSSVRNCTVHACARCGSSQNLDKSSASLALIFPTLSFVFPTYTATRLGYLPHGFMRGCSSFDPAGVVRTPLIKYAPLTRVQCMFHVQSIVKIIIVKIIIVQIIIVANFLSSIFVFLFGSICCLIN